MSTNDDDAASFYEDPENRRPTGRPQARKGQPRRLSEYFPVRFDAATIEAVRRIAEDDGLTASAWVRKVVARRSAVTAKSENGA